MPPGLVDSRGNPIASHGAQVARGAFGDTAHNAASWGREMRDWFPSMGSADADMEGEVDTIRGRARDLERNEGMASSALSAQTYAIVGAGPQCVPTPDYIALGKDKAWADGWSRIVRAKARSYFNSTDVDATRTDAFGAMTALMLQSTMLNGASLALPVYLPDSGQTEYGTAFHCVEIDRLTNPNFAGDSRDCRGGVEIDRYGAPVAYNILTQHPGDARLGMGAYERKWDRVPAFTRWGRRRVIHLFQRKRWGQTNGISVLANVLPEFRTLNRYRQAELQSNLVNSLIALIVKSNMTWEQVASMFSSGEDYLKFRNANPPGFGKRGMEAGGGTIVATPGDEITAFAPGRNASNFDQFTKSILRQIFAGMDMPYEVGSRDFSSMNYSNARVALMTAWQMFDTKFDWLVKRWCGPAYECWFEEAVALGEIPDCTSDDLFASASAWGAWTRQKWIGQGRGWVDPLKEAAAVEKRLHIGLTTMEKESAQQGEDWIELADQRHTEREYYLSKGMPYPGDAPVNNGGTPAGDGYRYDNPDDDREHA